MNEYMDNEQLELINKEEYEETWREYFIGSFIHSTSRTKKKTILGFIKSFIEWSFCVAFWSFLLGYVPVALGIFSLFVSEKKEDVYEAVDMIISPFVRPITYWIQYYKYGKGETPFND